MSKRRKTLYRVWKRASARYERRMRTYGWCPLTAEALRLAQHLHEHYRWSDTVGPRAGNIVFCQDAVRRESKRHASG